jgi:hypothetical protein
LDDEFAFHGRDSKIVWGITRNPVEKRLVVVFRGSITPRDWEQDFKVQAKEVALAADALRCIVPNPDEELFHALANVQFHSGFHEYLFEMEHNDETKFHKIVREVLKRVKEPRNEGYTVYITGHSLGGALATLAASALALNNDVKKPIKLLSFASPHVGKSDFAQAFRHLEKAGRIQHLRITNDDDAVPQGLGVFGYMHTGLHLNLSKDTHTLQPSSQDEFSLSDLNVSGKWFIGNPSHLLQEHRKRLDVAKNDLVSRTFDGIFQER